MAQTREETEEIEKQNKLRQKNKKEKLKKPKNEIQTIINEQERRLSSLQSNGFRPGPDQGQSVRLPGPIIQGGPTIWSVPLLKKKNAFVRLFLFHSSRLGRFQNPKCGLLFSAKLVLVDIN
ncbi:hypothetical protein ACE6H2_004702 [Prunus campanulata]